MSREGMVLERHMSCAKCGRRKCWLLGVGVHARGTKCGHVFVIK